MAASSEPVFAVNAATNPVLVRIQGRASYLNSTPLGEFFTRVAAQGKARFQVDCTGCTGMDSTFLGILAGAAMELKELNPPGGVTLVGLNPRHLELIRNLGLHRLLEVREGPVAAVSPAAELLPNPKPASEAAQAKVILAAHERLVQVDEANRPKFQDVITFLKSQVHAP